MVSTSAERAEGTLPKLDVSSPTQRTLLFPKAVFKTQPAPLFKVVEFHAASTKQSVPKVNSVSRGCVGGKSDVVVSDFEPSASFSLN